MLPGKFFRVKVVHGFGSERLTKISWFRLGSTLAEPCSYWTAAYYNTTQAESTRLSFCESHVPFTKIVWGMIIRAAAAKRTLVS